jgi:TnpA family transposase
METAEIFNQTGGGTLSSSDGQRIPVAGKIRKATALPRYFRYQGLTFYSWTSDQLSQYGTKVIPATVRDATYVLDALLVPCARITLRVLSAARSQISPSVLFWCMSTVSVSDVD